MRFAKQIVAITLALACGFGMAQGLPNTDAADDAIAVDADTVCVMSYRIEDLPVWSQNGKMFNPTILMAYLKASVDTDAWGASSKMAPYAEKSCLVIATTSANHEEIQNVLKRLRTAALKPNAK